MKRTALIALLCTIPYSSIALGSSIDDEEPISYNNNPAWDADWETNEQQFLSEHFQLTSEQQFVKAGESYFSADGKSIIFQAIPIPPEGEKPSPYYSMYVAQLERDKDKNITGIVLISKISEDGSSNTCGWFHPTERNTVLFGTTTTAPTKEEVAGFQRGTSNYAWQFPREMEIVKGTFGIAVKEETREKKEGEPKGISIEDFTFKMGETEALWERDGYDAEASWSPDGRYVLYTRLEPGEGNGDIWIYDNELDKHTALIEADGYDGGPFFSPDMKSICYRSDRKGDQLLQIFVAYLQFDESGTITGIKEEVQITDNGHVNWCPFFTVDGRYLLYATSEQSHGNYEIYCVDASGDYPVEQTPRMRVTHARGFDGLPAFSPDGKYMMWTAQRGPQREGEDRPSSQLWVAKLDLLALHWAYEAEREKIFEEMESNEFKDYDPTRP
jgi:hypothetical protein